MAAPVAVHGACSRPAARAWLEHETCPEARRLLHSPPSPSPAPKQQLLPKQQPLLLPAKVKVKTKESRAQERRKRIIAALHPPYFVLCMISIMVYVHEWGSRELYLSMVWSPFSWRQEPWRLISYAFAHANGFHLSVNAVISTAVGWRLQAEQSWWRVALVWAAGVAGGALGAGALQPAMVVVGASAAVYAMLFAHLPNVCLRFKHVPLWWFRPLSVVVLLSSDASFQLLRADEGRVAWSAHLCGSLVGLTLPFLVFTGEHAGSRHVVLLRLAAGFVLVLAGASAVAYYAAVPPPPHTAAPKWMNVRFR